MKKAFTLLELIIAVLIIGILVSIAIPRFQFAVERARAAEGVQILGILRRAQIRYNSIHPGQWLQGLYSAVDLDVSITTPRYFDPNQTYIGHVGTMYGEVVAGTVRRNDNPLAGQYNLRITLQGDVLCMDGGVSGICERLNIPLCPQ